MRLYGTFFRLLFSLSCDRIHFARTVPLWLKCKCKCSRQLSLPLSMPVRMNGLISCDAGLLRWEPGRWSSRSSCSMGAQRSRQALRTDSKREGSQRERSKNPPTPKPYFKKKKHIAAHYPLFMVLILDTIIRWLYGENRTF